jgi:hypothetical protein
MSRIEKSPCMHQAWGIGDALLTCHWCTSGCRSVFLDFMMNAQSALELWQAVNWDVIWYRSRSWYALDHYWLLFAVCWFNADPYRLADSSVLQTDGSAYSKQQPLMMRRQTGLARKQHQPTHWLINLLNWISPHSCFVSIFCRLSCNVWTKFKTNLYVIVGVLWKQVKQPIGALSTCAPQVLKHDHNVACACCPFALL